MPKYFDFHSHLNFADYQDDLEEVVGRLRETGTHTIVVGTDFESSAKGVNLAGRHLEIYACIGVHPVGDEKSFDVEKFESLITHPKVVMVGECGFDFYHAKKEEDYERQKKVFTDQVAFALKHDKPVMIHARNAYDEILDILSSLGSSTSKLKGNIHFFTGSLQEARRFIDLGFTLSFTGPITFSRDYDEVIKSVPLESIIAETDAPYASPIPYRGKRNEPSFVHEVVKKIAEIRGEDFELVRETLVKNALRMIGLSL